MNKLFTKIASLALGAAMAFGVGVAVSAGRKDVSPAKATDYNTPTNYSLASAVPSGLTASTSLTRDSSGRGMGKAGATYTLTTSTSFTDVGKIVVNAATNYGTYSAHSVSAKVGGSAFGSAQSFTAKASTNYTIEASKASGIVVVSLNNGKEGTTKTNTIWCLSIDIYTVAAPTTTYTVTFAVNTAGYGTVSQSSITNVPSGTSISTSNNTVTINGTTVTATPTTNTAQYTYAFTGWSNNTGTVTAARTITANFTRTTNTFTVGGTINNGSLSSTASVSYGSALNITINPSSGYVLPDTLTSVTMGGVAYAGYTYNNSTGAFSIASVTGNVVINATCPIDGVTHNISGTITNGTLTGDTGAQAEGGDFVVQISPSTYYKYPTTVSVTGAGDENDGWEYSSSDGIVYIYGLTSDVTITATCPAASITSISVAGQKTSFTLGESFSFGGTVKASYDDAAGSTNVTISTDLVNINSSAYDAFTESNSYTISVALKSNGSVSTSYTVSVTRKSISTTTTYNLVEDSKTDWSGEYVIMSADASYTYTLGTTLTNGRVANGTAPTVSNKIINTVSAKQTWTISKNGDYYNIKNNGTGSDAGEGKYLVATTAKNKAEFGTDKDDDHALWSISYSDGFVITNKGRADDSDTPANQYLRNNTTSGWASYSSGQGNAPTLFEKVETPSDVRSLIRLTATGPAANVKTEDDEVSASDFVATALFDTAESTTVTPTVVSVNGGSASSHLVEGSNTVVLSYTDPNNGSNTKTCQVTVIAAEQTAVLDGITWDKAGISIVQFDGSTIVYGSLHKHFDNDTTVALDITECTVAVYSNNSGTKAHDIANPTSYTLSLENDNGKYLGVTYSGYTLYSGVVNVVETINAVYGKVEQFTFTTKASDTNPIAVGDTVVFAYAEESYEMTSITSGSYGVVESFTSNPIGTYALTVEEGSSSGSFAFKNGSDYVAYDKDEGTTKNNNLWTQTTLDDKASWTVEYEGDNNDVVVLTNVHNTERSLRFNTNSGQERIAGYLGSSFPGIQVYKGHSEWVPSGDSIANTNVTVQKAVLEYAVHFNETMNCVNGGTTANVSGKWSTLSGDFDDLLDSFSGDNLAHCKALFAGADAVEEGDTLQDMLARYEYICAKYQLDDFLADIDRPPVEQAPRVSPLAVLTESGSAVTIVVVTSMIGLSAVGGYFFLRKRKEI